MKMHVFHTELGPGVLTDEHPDFDRVVFISDDTGQISTASHGYLHTAGDGTREEQYTPEQLAWIDDLIVAWETTPMPKGWSHFRDGAWVLYAGASLKTAAQLRRIEALSGRVFLV